LQIRSGCCKTQLLAICKQYGGHAIALTLYYHPFSSYSWKALIPLYEAGTPFAP